ncbi:MAG: YicC family protein [Nitrospinae bacterium]|nr:YicC family protein [Nitrospinota bacterium]
MVRSMTGFARAESTAANRKCVVEIRTVNNRFLEFNVRMPAKDLEIEKRVKKSFAEKVTRGYVEISITVSDGEGVKRKLALDEDLAGQFIKAAKTLKDKYGIGGEPDLASLLSLKDIFRYEEDETNLEERWELIRGALAPAVEALVAMRSAEGSALEKDLLEKLSDIEASAANIIESRRGQEKEIVKKFRERLEELTAGIEADPQRIMQEAGVMAERSDISEEIIRLQCHITQLRELLAKGGAMGRKVEFIVQEMNREANTIGSKSTLFDISREVVEIKSNLEKLREQAANVE